MSNSDEGNVGWREAMTVDHLQRNAVLNAHFPLTDHLSIPTSFLPSSSPSTNTDKHKDFIQTTQRKHKKSTVLPFATKHDLLLFYSGLFITALTGALLPISVLFSGKFLNAAADRNLRLVNLYTILQLCVAVFSFLTAAISTTFLEWSAENQLASLRAHYYHAILNQDQTYKMSFDNGELADILEDHGAAYRLGIGSKGGQLINLASQFTCGFIMAFATHWKLAAILSGMIPVLLAGGAFTLWSVGHANKKMREAYAGAANILEETFGNIRTIISYCLEDTFLHRYEVAVNGAYKAAARGGVLLGLGMGLSMGSLFAFYALGFWAQGRMLAEGYKNGCYADIDPSCLSVGGGLTVFFCIAFGSFSLGQAAPPLAAVVKSKESIRVLMAVIDRQSTMPVLGASGKKWQFRGAIEFIGVGYAYNVVSAVRELDAVMEAAEERESASPRDGYETMRDIVASPARRLNRWTSANGEVKQQAKAGLRRADGNQVRDWVFNDLHLNIAPGESVAFVGPSGCGKSTIAKLLLRFDDVTEGSLRFDNIDVRSIDVNRLRSQIGYVGQEPQLFRGTVEDNIRHGDPHALHHQVVEAARMANAHDFIMALPQQYKTEIGEGGDRLSGGQRQRLAIARALVREPAILLLDEATSALDTKSEKIVQNNIHRLSMMTGMTTLIIAHRLTTVKKCDRIFVFQLYANEGHTNTNVRSYICETGTHDFLMSKNGVYAGLVRTQGLTDSPLPSVTERAETGAPELSSPRTSLLSPASMEMPSARRSERMSSLRTARPSPRGVSPGRVRTRLLSAPDEDGQVTDRLPSITVQHEPRHFATPPSSRQLPPLRWSKSSRGDHGSVPAIFVSDGGPTGRQLASGSGWSSRHFSCQCPPPEMEVFHRMPVPSVTWAVDETSGSSLSVDDSFEDDEPPTDNELTLESFMSPTFDDLDNIRLTSPTECIPRRTPDHQTDSCVGSYTFANPGQHGAPPPAEMSPKNIEVISGGAPNTFGNFETGRRADMRRTWRYFGSAWSSEAIGLFGAACNGCVFPLFAWCFAKFVGVMALPDALSIESGLGEPTTQLLSVALFCFVANIIHFSMLERAGQAMVKNLRLDLFDHTVHLPAAFYDQQRLQPGYLLSVISADTYVMKGWASDNIALIVQNLATLILATTIAALISFKLAAISLAGFLLMVPAVFLQGRFLSSNGQKGGMERDADRTSNLLMETLRCSKTVDAFCLHDQLAQRYDRLLYKERAAGRRTALIAGFFAGLSHFLEKAAQALNLWCGGRAFAAGTVQNVGDMIQATFTMVIAAMGIGQASGGMTDAAKGKDGAQRFYSLRDVPLVADARCPAGHRAEDATRPIGEIELDVLHFEFPGEPPIEVYEDLTLRIPAGSSVALVGESGCGKTTLLQLLERFYELDSDPQLYIGGVELRDWNVKSLRSRIAMVAQEPVLFNDTVEQNIRYGHQTASMYDIQSAAIKANAHEFIMQLPEGYQTNVGVRGERLSGGQRQRVAIARAMLKKSDVILLDEPTSALDSASEKVVQEALENLLADKESGKTTIMVAHRLSSIRNCSLIIVLKKLVDEDGTNRGAVVAEMGTHEALMELPFGEYRRMVGATTN